MSFFFKIYFFFGCTGCFVAGIGLSLVVESWGSL